MNFAADIPTSTAQAEGGQLTWRLIGAGKKLHAFKGNETKYAVCGIGGRTSGPCDRPEEWPRCKFCVWLMPSLDNNPTLD